MHRVMFVKIRSEYIMGSSMTGVHDAGGRVAGEAGKNPPISGSGVVDRP